MTVQNGKLQVVLNRNGSSPDPIKAIWGHQHVCVKEDLVTTLESDYPNREKMVSAIVKEMKMGHWSVTEAAFAQISFDGFSHATAMQFRVHRGFGTLTNSLRYTGYRFEKVHNLATAQECFFDVTLENLDVYILACMRYRDAVDTGVNRETARNLLPSGYRQSWSMAGNLRQWFHLLDQRLLADTQDVSRLAAQMAVRELREWCPELVDFYQESRAGKNKLSP